MSDTATVTVRYFAWLREKTGVRDEVISIPEDTETVAQLMAWMATRGDNFAAAFAKPGVIRAAINQVYVKPDASLAGAREIGFFPPVTGG